MIFSFDRNIDLKKINYLNETAKDMAIRTNLMDVVDIFSQYEKNKDETIKEFKKELGLKNLNLNQRFISACSDEYINKIKRIFKKKKIHKI